MLKSFRSTEASSGEALNGDEICSLGPSPLEDVLFELIGFQWTRRFLLIERFKLLRGRMFERRGRRAEAVLVRGKKERRKRLGCAGRLQRARRTEAGKFSHKQKAHGFCPRLFDGSVSNAQFLPRLSRMKSLGLRPDLRCGVPFHGIGTAVPPTRRDEVAKSSCLRPSAAGCRSDLQSQGTA